MKLSVLVAVVLRLFALWWLVLALGGTLASVAMVRSPVSHSAPLDLLNLLMFWGAPAFHLAAAAAAWGAAHFLARRLVATPDPTVEVSALTPQSLYTLGAMTIGLYFALGHLAPMFNWLHFLALQRASPTTATHLDFYEVTSQVIPCLAGIATFLAAPRIGRSLAAQ